MLHTHIHRRWLRKESHHKKNNRAEPFTLPVRCEERERKEHERRKRKANMKTRHERSVPLYTYFSDNSQIIMLKLLINSNTPCTDINKYLRTCVYLHCIQTWLLRNFHEFYFRIWNQKLKMQIYLHFLLLINAVTLIFTKCMTYSANFSYRMFLKHLLSMS